MTTIAWDGSILAADSRITNETIIGSDNSQKLYKLHNIEYFDDTLIYAGFSGLASDDQKYLAYLHSGTFWEDELEFELGGIIVGLEYVYVIESNTPHLVRFPRKSKLAEGSGGPYARSAMEFGLNAIDAIKHAKKFDSATGGRIRWLKLSR